jgi:predicted small metal-binding protein
LGLRRRALALGEVDGSPRRSRGAYDVIVKQIDCVCGVVVKGEDDDELWERAQEHLRSDHPDLAGKVSREDILAQAEET